MTLRLEKVIDPNQTHENWVRDFEEMFARHSEQIAEQARKELEADTIRVQVPAPQTPL